MIKFSSWLMVIAFIVVLSGCQTTSKVQAPQESSAEVHEALSTVAGALSGKSLTKEELKELETQIRNDEEAQSAVRAITDTVGGKTPAVKYCPITGKRYAAHIEICPEHQVQLEKVGE